MTLDAITHVYELRCSGEHAFEVYTRRIGDWWHPDYTHGAATLQGVTIEPRVGGRVFATHSDIGDDDWGKVTVWEPGGRLVYTSTLAQPADSPSEIAVAFAPSAGGCTVRFEHGGWNASNAQHRQKFTEWRIILDRFAALADAHSGPG